MFLVIPSICFFKGVKLWILFNIKKLDLNFKLFQIFAKNLGGKLKKVGNLLVRIHFCRIWSWRYVLFNGPLYRWHGYIWNTLVVKPLLEIVFPAWVWDVIVQINLYEIGVMLISVSLLKKWSQMCEIVGSFINNSQNTYPSRALSFHGGSSPWDAAVTTIVCVWSRSLGRLRSCFTIGSHRLLVKQSYIFVNNE
jgi:hypothetical protein